LKKKKENSTTRKLIMREHSTAPSVKWLYLTKFDSLNSSNNTKIPNFIFVKYFSNLKKKTYIIMSNEDLY